MRSFLALLVSTLAACAQTPDELAKSVKTIFTTHCYRCHGQNSSAQGGFDNVLDLKAIVDGKRIAPKDAAKSRIYKRMSPDLIGDMPDDTLTKPTAAEIATVKAWIDAGAPPGVEEKAAPRKFMTLADEVKAVDDYLMNKVPAKDWQKIRFFSLRTLHNAPREKVKDADLVLYKAALSKLLNSLSWRNKIVVPDAVDADGVVLAVNIEDLDWLGNKNLWREILKRYPYGLSHARYPEDPAVNNRWSAIVEKTGAEIPVLRTDWFIALASRPPLYHTLSQIPDTLDKLVMKLPAAHGHLDLERDITEGKVARAGFNGSGVSERNNRMIERHETGYGAFWISYDFKVSAGKGNLFVFPLGPAFKANPFDRFAFQHDGGEVIFNLPNGMQAYMLVKADGGRIDEGPIEIVSDGKNKISGTPAIVNGVSCMSCHQHGMIRKADQIRDSHALGGKAKERINELYLKEPAMDALFEQDEKRFQDATTACVKPFLMTGENARKTLKDFAEPIGPIAKWYVAEELSLTDAARELGVEKPEVLSGTAEANPDLHRLGLLPLARGKRIKREVWESQQFLTSAFQSAAAALKLGEPVVIK